MRDIEADVILLLVERRGKYVRVRKFVIVVVLCPCKYEYE